MSSRTVKSAVKRVVPPVVWDAMKTCWRMRPILRRGAANRTGYSVSLGRDLFDPNASRIITTVEELDREIARCNAAAVESDDALRRAMGEFTYEPNIVMPADPDSPEYRAAQMKLYHEVSGRDSYHSSVNEQQTIDFAFQNECPFPYCTKSSVTVGEQLMAIGFLIRAMNARPGQRILEFGIGFGKTTTEFAQMGLDITGVDVNPEFLELNRLRCERQRLKVELVRSDMLDFQPVGRYDFVLFYESFHHCRNPQAMIRRLDSLVAPGGSVVFAGEPIWSNCPFPWTIRLDGVSAFSIRKHGWFELGFRTDYFVDLLARNGWTTTMTGSLDVPWQNVFIAVRR